MKEILGEVITNEDEAERVKRLLKNTQLVKLLKHPQSYRLREMATKEYVKESSAILDPVDIVHACDSACISRDAYAIVFNLIKKKCDKILVGGTLPRPINVRNTRRKINIQIHSLLGEYKHVTGQMPYMHEGKSKVFEYHEKNNIFVDLYRLQTMILRYYDFNISGKFYYYFNIAFKITYFLLFKNDANIFSFNMQNMEEEPYLF